MSAVLLILFSVLLFGFIIFIHEFGHFFTAKLFGIRVNEFALGMGPKLFGFQKGETSYSLRLFPIGGYCAMEGEDEESNDENAFYKKAVWKRMIVVAAGGILNIVLGLVLVFILTCQQESFGYPVIAKFADNSVLQTAGMQEGDVFHSIDDYRIYTDRDLNFALAFADPNGMDIKVKRGDEILTFSDVSLLSSDENGNAVTQIDFYILGKNPTFLSTLQKTVGETVSTARMVWKSLLGILSGRFGLNDLAGPIGTAQIITEAASQGLSVSFLNAINNILMVMSLLTVNLGLVNLLPIPALDGGRLLFLLVEGIFRKPVPQKYEGWVHTAGFVLLIGLTILISFNDVFRLITGHGFGG